MRLLPRIGCRIYQRTLYMGMFLLPWRTPRRLSSLDEIPAALQAAGSRKPLIVTDKGIAGSGLLDRLLAALGGLHYAVYQDTVPNPTLDNIETALAVYRAEGCDALVAIGGGSPMDCAKAVGARVARPRKPVEAMRGQLKVLRRISTLVAIPTTSGTGSEATLAAVVTNARTHEKYAINDVSLIPHIAVLDPALTVGLPPHLTAATGMDALTHAIEALIGRSNTRATRENGLHAIELIDRHLLAAYENGQDLQARAGMQEAAYLAGLAFTRAYVGYVHAIAHQLGALYGTPHGLANAILLPHVLAFYGEPAHVPLAAFAPAFGVPVNPQDDVAATARAVITKIRTMRRQMQIPEYAQDIRAEDIGRIARGAVAEGNPLYPVPRLLDEAEMQTLVKKCAGMVK